VADWTVGCPGSASLRKDEELPLTFFDFPTEHWEHLRTTDVVESPFATVRLRQRVTKRAGSRQKDLLMAFKLLLMAQKRGRRINGAHVIALVPAGVRFTDGVQAERRTPCDRLPWSSPACLA
jgi:transposase-like protein